MFTTKSKILSAALATLVMLTSLGQASAAPARTLASLDRELAQSKHLVQRFQEAFDPSPGQSADLRNKLNELVKSRNEVAAYERWIRDREADARRSEASYTRYANLYNRKRRTASRAAAQEFLKALLEFRAANQDERRKIQMLKDMRPLIHDPVMRKVREFNRIIRDGLQRHEDGLARSENA